MSWSIIRRILTSDLPVKTYFGHTDYFIMQVAGQPCLIKKTDMGIPFLVGGVLPISYTPWLNYEIIEVDTESLLPETGDSNYRYVTIDTLHSYFWTTAGYIDVTDGLTLGETSNTAGRGDWTKTAYDYSQGNTFSNISELDTIGDNYSLPNGEILLDSKRILFVYTEGLANRKCQIAYCAGGFLYIRNQQGASTWTTFYQPSITMLKYTSGNKAIEVRGEDLYIYANDLTSFPLISIDSTGSIDIKNKKGKQAIIIDDLNVAIGGSGLLAAIQAECAEFQFKIDNDNKSVNFDMENIPTGESKTFKFPSEDGTLATQEYLLSKIGEQASQRVTLLANTTSDEYVEFKTSGGVSLTDLYNLTTYNSFVINGSIIEKGAIQGLSAVSSIGKSGTSYSVDLNHQCGVPIDIAYTTDITTETVAGTYYSIPDGKIYAKGSSSGAINFIFDITSVTVF